TDPLGNSWKLAYKQHLLVQETNRNGLSFYFAYDGHGEDAFCIRTWGDGGIYDHVIDYDKVGKVTCVTNSLGHTTTYKMNVVGCVTEVMDPLGGTTKYDYDERTLRKVKETNPVGGETTWTYDARGKDRKVVGPDEAEVAVDFSPENQALRARDPVKGQWTWGYDAQGRMLGRVDPLGRRVQFHWAAEGRGGLQRLTSLTDPAGQDTALGYDGQGNVIRLRTPDSAESRWTYDNLGRCTAAIDPKGNVQRREHDALGRVVRVWEPDGNVRELAYDPEGNVVHARDKHHDVRFTYQGMGRIASRSEAGTTVGFSYDTEENLVAITNEHGHVYRFELDACRRIEVESGFDGLRRRYLRDKAGRVVKVFRPADRTTEYAYDDAGRVAAVQHSSGEAEAYAYRPDGELIEAKNDAAAVKLERDLLGRIVREVVGDDWVGSEYDALGARVRVTSSKGLDERITRDIMGLEIERHLPGGVQSRWERDAVGRPVKQEVWAAGQFRRAVQYTWDVDDRLKMVVDALRGPTHYEHDALGNLAAATYADGRVDLRMPDAVGNLFRTRDRTDRKYGPAGQLLEARREDGGLTTYDYDPEGNLIRKTEHALEPEAAPRVWRYEWNGAGMLARVVRPDGEDVAFHYDALLRRLSKTFRDDHTRWIWDRDTPVHESAVASQGIT